MIDNLISRKEAMQMLKISSPNTFQSIRDELKPVMIGKRMKFSVEHIKSYIEAKVINTEEEKNVISK